MSNSTDYGPEEAHYTRMRVLKILGLVLALCLACGLGTLFGGGLVYGVMKVTDDSSAAKVPPQVVVERELDVEELAPLQSPSAIIVEVMPGSPAEDVGIQPGDVVIAVDGEGLSGDRGLAELVAEHEPGDRIRLTVTRPGEGQRELRVRLAEHPDREGAPYLGVRFAAPPAPMPPGSRFLPFEGEEDADPYQMPHGMPGFMIEQGVLIYSVTEDGPASAAGLQEGDVILALDGEPIETPEQLVDVLGRYKAGDRVTLTYLRDEDEEGRQVTLTLAQHPEDPDRAFLGIMIGGTMQRRHFEGRELPQGFRFRGAPDLFGVPGDDMPFDPEKLPFEWRQLPFDWRELPFDWDQLPFDPREMPFDWHELEPDLEPGESSA
jgi:membrane-associated protease RseP (regulator of RpoE activity)